MPVSRVLLAAVLLVLGLPAVALAHGDGPTHYLEGVDLYPGFSPPPTSTVELQLMGFVEAAHRAGAPVKVAVASEGDVTDRPEALRRPQAYAEGIAKATGLRVPVIIVTPYGIGVAGAKAPDIDLPLHPSSDLMATTAIDVVRAVAAASGHPLPAEVPPARRPPAIASTEPIAGTEGGADGWLPFAVFGAVFGAAALLFEVRLRLRRRRGSPSTPLMVTEGP
jgi:hypothetical protein